MANECIFSALITGRVENIREFLKTMRRNWAYEVICEDEPELEDFAPDARKPKRNEKNSRHCKDSSPPAIQTKIHTYFCKGEHKMNLEAKKQISSIRSKYNSTGDVVFRTAILYLFTYGMGHVCFEDENSAVFEHPELFFVRDAYKCAVELTRFSVFNLLEYVQTADLFYEPGEFTYSRLFQIATSLLPCIDTDNADRAATYETLSGVLTDREIKLLGGEYILDAVKDV